MAAFLAALSLIFGGGRFFALMGIPRRLAPTASLARSIGKSASSPKRPFEPAGRLDWSTSGEAPVPLRRERRAETGVQIGSSVMPEVLSLVEDRPDMTLAEIANHLFKTHGERFVPSVLWRFFDRRNITFKKTLHASEQDRPDVAAERAAWKASQPQMISIGWCSSTKREPRPR
jgi:hypothetical protein